MLSRRFRGAGIGIVTFPLGNTGLVPLRNLVSLMLTHSKNVRVITGGVDSDDVTGDRRVSVKRIPHVTQFRAMWRIMSYIITQLRISHSIIQSQEGTGTWVFFIGGESLVLPVLTARLTCRRTILVLAGNPEVGSRLKRDTLTKLLFILTRFNFAIANKIVVYSRSIIEDRALERIEHKVRIAHEHFIDVGRFRIMVEMNKRNECIGYVGSYSEVKGIENLVDALVILRNCGCQPDAFLVGEGELSARIEHLSRQLNLGNSLTVGGWTPHDQLPYVYNKLRLLVIPSYSEGIPNVMLESMACGTPVLSTPVGAIGDVIRDGSNGFIMENNSPECIALNILRALRSGQLAELSEEARRDIVDNFSFERTVVMWEGVLGDES